MSFSLNSRRKGGRPEARHPPSSSSLRSRSASHRSPPPKVLTKQQIQVKQQNLSSSLREAETKQLTKYLKTRSMLLDQEIHQTREKLNLNLNPAPPDSPKLTLTRGTPQRASPKKRGASREEKEEELEMETYHKEEFQLKYLLKRLLQCDLLPPSPSPSPMPLLSSSRPLFSHFKGMEDSQMTPSQITSCFIPSQHMKFHQVSGLLASISTSMPSLPQGVISLRDAVETFHVDLVQPLSKQDQGLLLMAYGTERNDIDIQTLLQDLGYWDPMPAKGIPLVDQSLDDDLDAELPHQFRESTKRQFSPPRGSKRNELRRNDLADIHDLVKGSLSPRWVCLLSPTPNAISDQFKREGIKIEPEEDLEKDEDLISQLRTEMEKEKERISTSAPIPAAEPSVGQASEEAEEKKDVSPISHEKTIEMIAAENVARALAVENAKLKAELSAFDREFFEELEDLKLKYSELQTSQQLPQLKERESFHSRTNRPLSPRTIGRLGQSTRSSLKALSRGSGSHQFPLSGQYDMGQSLPGRLSFQRKRKPRSSFSWSLQTALPNTSAAPGKIPTLEERNFDPIDLQSSLRKSLSESLGRGSSGENETFGSLCERRLQFALQNHVDPGRATKTLLHEINSLAHTEKCQGFILPGDLHAILTNIGISMSSKEVEVFCTGFASNGAGGVDALELGRVIQTMMYNAINNPIVTDMDSESVLLEDAIERLLETLARDLLLSHQYGGELQEINRQLKLQQLKDNHTEESEQKMMTKIYLKVEQLLLDPFSELDQQEEGVMRRKEFTRILHGMSLNLSTDEVKLLTEYYVSRHDQAEADGEESIIVVDGILYPDFVHDIAHTVTELLLRGGVDRIRAPLRKGEGLGSSSSSMTTPWLLHEFDFVDELFNQLEAMKPSVQRKVLTQLQSHLTQQVSQSALPGALTGEDGSLDGYAVLKALISVGFNIPRDMRVKFLNHIESLSGRGSLNSYDLCAILSTSCIHWTTQERLVFGKILRAMGPTCSQRWQWLQNLKRDLSMSLQDTVRMKQTKQQRLRHQKQKNLPLKSWRYIEEENVDSDEDGHFLGDNFTMPASLFLHCLRENGVHLEIEEEAILLDCLDFESQSNSLYARDQEDLTQVTSSPEVSYLSFLTVCGQFAGKWYHSAPEINEHMKKTMLSMNESSVHESIKELETLFRAFDESSTNTIDFRPFLISCRRSRLLTSLEPAMAEELGKLLVEEGEGKIRYISFLFHLKAVHHAIKRFKAEKKMIVSQSAEAGDRSYEISHQLLRNGSEPITGTLKPIREYLSQLHWQQQSQQPRGKQRRTSSPLPSPLIPLSSREITDLLREFNVVYNPQDLEVLLDTISSSKVISDYFEETPAHSIHWNHSSQLITKQPTAAALLHVLQQIRLPWSKRHPQLAKKFRRLLSRMTTEGIAKLFTRLQAFARASLFSALAVTGDTLHLYPQLEQEISETYVSSEIFQVILGRCGLSLNDQEIYFLCDESDAHPSPSMVRISILLEALAENEEKDGIKRHLEEIYMAMDSTLPAPQWKDITQKKYEDPSSGLFALEHLRTLLWNTASSLKRRPEEWRGDVMSLMDGFDCGGGVMTTDDFVLALSLLSIRLSEDILLAVPRISSSLDLIPYRQIFGIIFDTSSDQFHLTHQQASYGVPSSSRLSTAAFSSSRSSFRPSSPPKPTDSVQTLVNLIRKTLNLFLSQQSDLEQAWSTLLTVFTKFDPNQDNVVSPRDFCLAVSVLMDGDSPVFTKQQWQQVIDYFRSDDPSAVGVDYLAFLDAVLDSTSAAAAGGRGGRRDGSSHPRDTLSSSLRKHRWNPSDLSPERSSKMYTATSQGLKSRLNRTHQPQRSSPKKTVTYSEFPVTSGSDYYTEDPEDYGRSSTISGRGVVGASFSNKSRLNQLSKTAIPRTSSKYDEFFGPLPSTISRSLSLSTASTSTSTSPDLSSSQLKFLSHFDTFTVKEFNSELFDSLTIKLGLSDDNRGGGGGGGSRDPENGASRKKLLLRYLDMEDKNHSGTLSRHSFLAGLNALGISHSFWSKPLQRMLIDKLVELGGGEIVIKDAMKLIIFQ